MILQVAPFAGAWIEILLNGFNGTQQAVAPFAGAWIEIKRTWCDSEMFWSLPSRERGLKFFIEINLCYSVLSLPSRERGLKFLLHKNNTTILQSLPSRERGLKLL